jgi:shikimate dehydrogenase
MPRPSRLVLLGQPVAHSLSPVFQNAALQHAGLRDLVYEAQDVHASDLHSVLASHVAAGAAGNVTIPHKESVAQHCDVLTPLAAQLGAVNTWWSVDGKLHGDNTDVGGFNDAVVTLLGSTPVRQKIAVLGAGGAARAVLAAIRGWVACDAAVWSRTISRSESIQHLGPAGRTSAEEFMAQALRGAALIVNSTPVGLHDEQVPVNPGVLARDAAVLDLVYKRSGPTSLVALALQSGRRADDGLAMLVAQGARSWERWFGDVAPNREVMRAAIKRPG